MKFLIFFLFLLNVVISKPISREIYSVPIFNTIVKDHEIKSIYPDLTIKDNCYLYPKKRLYYNNTCITCKLAISILSYENLNNNYYKTLNYLGKLCNSSFLTPYLNLTKECNAIFYNGDRILEDLNLKKNTSVICNNLKLC